MAATEYPSLEMSFEAHVEGTCAEIDLINFQVSTAGGASEHSFRFTIEEAQEACLALASNILEADGFDSRGKSATEVFFAYLAYIGEKEDRNGQ